MEVVLFHYVWKGERIKIGIQSPLRGISSGGFEAVSFFFVLSGFILTYVYIDHSEPTGIRATAKQFWRARIARIVPAYYLGLLLTLPPLLYGAFIAKNVILNQFLPSLLLSPLLLQAWWPPSALSWNGPGWSLSVECAFYVMFPGLALKTKRLNTKYFLATAYCLVLLVDSQLWLFGPILRSTLKPDTVRNFLGYFPLFQIPTFLVGMALGRIYIERDKSAESLANWHLIFWLCAILLFMLFGFRVALPMWLFRKPVLVPLFGLLIYSCARAEKRLSVLHHPALVLLGEASYAIYILHDALPFWWDEIWHRVIKVRIPPITDFAVLVSVVILVCYFSFVFLETPLRRIILGHREHRMA